MTAGRSDVQPSYETLVACSSKCSEDFAQKVLDYPAIADIGTDTENFGRNARELFNKAVMKAFNEASGKNHLIIRTVEHANELDTKQYNAFVTRRLDKGNWVTGGLMDRFAERARLACAQNLERVGRPLDAANGYEKLKMYDKARELREKDKQVVVKGTNVTIDLNRLLQQVKDGGIVAVYRCPHCGGKLKVDKNVDIAKLKVCEHCGSEIESMDLADFLKTALS